MKFGIAFANAVLPEQDPGAVRRTPDLGISRPSMAPPAFDAEGLARSLADFADRIIAKV